MRVRSGAVQDGRFYQRRGYYSTRGAGTGRYSGSGSPSGSLFVRPVTPARARRHSRTASARGSPIPEGGRGSQVCAYRIPLQTGPKYNLTRLTCHPSRTLPGPKTTTARTEPFPRELSGAVLAGFGSRGCENLGREGSRSRIRWGPPRKGSRERPWRGCGEITRTWRRSSRRERRKNSTSSKIQRKILPPSEVEEIDIRFTNFRTKGFSKESPT